MPGPTQWRNITVMNSYTAGKLSEETITERARNVLDLIKFTRRSEIPENAKECSRDVEEDRTLLRRLAAESIVLMKNESNILPLKRDRTVSVLLHQKHMVINLGVVISINMHLQVLVVDLM